MKVAPNAKTVVKAALCLCLVLFFTNKMAFSQDNPEPTPSPTATPENEETRKLKEQIELLKLKKEKEELEKAINDTKFPKPTATPLEGKTEIDANVKIESEMVAYRALSESADFVVADIKKKNLTLKNVAVLNSQMIKTLQTYSATINQLDLMSEEYKKLLVNTEIEDEKIGGKPKMLGIDVITGGLSIAQSVLGTFVDLIALLRTDTSITGNSFTIQESAFVSELFRGFKKDFKDINLYYPAEFSPKPNGLTRYQILQKIENLYFLRAKSEQLLTEIAEFEKGKQENKTKIETLEKRLKLIPQEIQTALDELKILETVYQRFPTASGLEKLEIKKKQIADLKKEESENPKQTAKAKESLAAIEQSLQKLYAQLRSSFSATEVIAAFKPITDKFDEALIKYLGKDDAELDGEDFIAFVQEADNAVKQEILRKAAAKKGSALSDAEKNELFNPVVPFQKQMLRKFLAALSSDLQFNLTGDFSLVFTDDEFLQLLYPDEGSRQLKKEALLKNKQNIISRLKALNAQFSKFYEDMIKVDAAAGINPITSYLQGENLRKALNCGSDNNCPNSYLISVKVINAGGNNQVKKNLITNVFTGADISHSGGAIVEYRLYDTEGNVKSSNTFTVYEPYRKAKSISETTKKSNNTKIQ